MKLRKERRHQYGNSNSTFKTDKIGKPPKSMNKFGYLASLRQTQFYKSTVKQEKEFGRKTNIPIISIDNKNQNRLREINKKYGQSCNPKPKARAPIDNCSSTRMEMRKDNMIETQPVFWDRIIHKNDDENKFDVKKILEFKKSLFQRYSKRKNQAKLFTAWDKGRKGYIDEKDVVKMSSLFGCPMNITEARLLVSSADQNMDGKLNPNEFINLIYNRKLICCVENGPSTEGMNEKQIGELFNGYLNNIAAGKQKEIIFDKLKNNRSKLQGIIRSDEFNKKDISVDKEGFIRILEKMNANKALLKPMEIDFLYSQECNGEGRVDLQKFCVDVMNYENQNYSKLISEAFDRGHV